MAIYQQSTLTLANAKSAVAAAGGGEGDSTMETMAQRAIEQALDKWNNYWPWDYLRTTTELIQVKPPFYDTAVGPVSAGSTFFQSNNPNFALSSVYPKSWVETGEVGHRLYMADNPARKIASFATFIFLSGTTPILQEVPNGAPMTFYKRDYALPADVRTIYDVRLLQSGRQLWPSDHRIMDVYGTYPELQTGTPSHYSLFGSVESNSNVIRLFPSPDTWDLMQVKYWRRAQVFTAATVTSTILDIPQDAEFGVLSLAKAYFLADRGGETERMMLWRQEGEDTLRTFRAREQQNFDELTAFQPGANVAQTPFSVNDIRPYTDW